MRKKKKRIHKFKRLSRRFIIALMLVLQVLLLVLIGYLSTAQKDQGWVFWTFYVFVSILNAAALVHIVYVHGDPAFKVPWIIALLALPGVGVLIYLVFRTHPLPKDTQLLLRETGEKASRYFPPAEAKEKAKKDPYFNAFALIESSSFFRLSEGNRFKYYKNGETFFPEFIERLKNAKEFIFLEFFIVADGIIFDQIHDILVQKAQEGVDVRFVYDDVGCFTTVSVDFYKQLQKEGIKCYPFNKVGFLLLGFYNNRSHRKIAVIDHDYAYTGGMNLADEYANAEERFGYWKDSMIQMEGPIISTMIAIFLSDYDIARRTVDSSEYDRFLDHVYPTYEDGGYALAFGTGPENFYPLRLGELNFTEMIHAAKETIDICTPYFIPSDELLHAIEQVALRGVRVRLFLPQIPDKKIPYLIAKYHIPYLNKVGVQVYFFTPGFNHEKTMIVDGKLAFVGSINMDYRSLVHHFENGITIYGGEVMGDIQEDFNEMAEASTRVPNSFSLTAWQKILVALLSVFFPLL